MDQAGPSGGKGPPKKPGKSNKLYHIPNCEDPKIFQRSPRPALTEGSRSGTPYEKASNSFTYNSVQSSVRHMESPRKRSANFEWGNKGVKITDESMLNLETLIKLSKLSSDELLVKLIMNTINFNEILDLKLTYETFQLIIKILLNVCSIPLINYRINILNLALNEKFMMVLQNFVIKIIFSKPPNIRITFFEELVDLLQSIFDTVPSTASEVLSNTLEICNHGIITLVKQGTVSSTIQEKLENLQQNMQIYQTEMNKNMIDNQTPDDFRKITVYPTAVEILSKPFVRKNIIDKRFLSVDHYLDIQFRLLKEDFVAPLREGILEYQQQNSKKIPGIRIYKNVSFLSPTYLKGQIGVMVQFEFANLKKKRSKSFYAKRFMYGSLLCFTRDEFKTLLFGKVIDGNPELLESGKVVVGFEGGQENYSLNEFYLMIECSVYFEPYYHVLKALQTIYNMDFPMKKYIIDLDPQVLRPSYLKDGSVYKIEQFEVTLFAEQWSTPLAIQLNDCQYKSFITELIINKFTVIQDLSSSEEILIVNLTKDNLISTFKIDLARGERLGGKLQLDKEQFGLFIEGLAKDLVLVKGPHNTDMSVIIHKAIKCLKHYRVNVASFKKEWPKSSELQLDDTQLEAFKAGLMKEFVVIQGPPGTGKTFIGLKIAKTLISNRGQWYENSPILVICYTNHALDQFLEGVIHATYNVVRVGGQSKNSNLERFNLRAQRKKFVLDNRHLLKAISDVEFKLGNMLSDIQYFSRQLCDIKNYSSIIDFKKFGNIDSEFSKSWFYKAQKQEIIDWLFGRNTTPYNRSKKQSIQMESDGTENLYQDKDINEKRELKKIFYEQNRSHYEMFDEITEPQVDGDDYNLISINSIKQEIRKTEDLISNLKEKGDKPNQKSEERKVTKLNEDLEYLQSQMKRYKNVTVPTERVHFDLTYPHWMTTDYRWRLYFYWVTLYQNYVIKKLQYLEREHQILYEKFLQLRDLQDTEVMKHALVVGMTTTSAARLQTSIQSLRSPIVLIEEAAEVLESHIVVSLTKYCKHVILIGDHQQLRPPTASHRMNVRFNLGISLFERMILNNVQFYTLGVQHRMRPEIAKLIVPAIYPKLENHSSVEEFPTINGIDHVLYFIDHNYPEEEMYDSKVNNHEVKFLIALAKYLIQNGYKPSEITIIAAYSAQMFAFWTERKKYSDFLEEVKITVLDNYQGEENKIILLSLVRNNQLGKIGFLKTENRVCVALSRAREGFYMMGNMKLLCQASKIWPKIKEALEIQNSLGMYLTLRCQIHSSHYTQVTSEKDFMNVPHGGCNQICNDSLVCGHICSNFCHVYDRKHEEIKCKSKCHKICKNDHLCLKLCYQECGPCPILINQVLSCSHEITLECSADLALAKCQVLVEAKLPCGHTFSKKPCYLPVEKQKCLEPCQIRVEPCGHSCSVTCHVNDDPDHVEYKCKKNCERPADGCSTGEHKCENKCFEKCSPCVALVEKKRSTCTHRIKLKCNENPDYAKCIQSCRRSLTCNHPCKLKCFQPCDCKVKVEKKLNICNHMVKTKCIEEPSRDDCIQQCPLILSCGHPCRQKCNETCTKECKVLVNHNKSSDCGHTFKIHCYLLNENIPSNSYILLSFCNAPCTKTLECGHACAGTCGKCAQGRIHISCKQKCGSTLVCGHECRYPCREACQPCNLPCSYSCPHSLCGKKCGQPCTKCVEKCLRKCEHFQCLQKCGEICSKPPCTKPCKEILNCSHPCIGFCGDPCPPLCRICDYDQVTETFFGTEDGENAIFVLLDECQHVLESSGMEQWMNVKMESEIQYKTCPKCKTILSSTLRYSEYIKSNLKDVQAVKLKVYGSPQQNKQLIFDLKGKLNIIKNYLEHMDGSKWFYSLINNMLKTIDSNHKNRRQTLNCIQAQKCSSKIQILENVVGIFISANFKNRTVINEALIIMDFLLEFLHKIISISNQEISDFQNETKRFSRIIQLLQIKDSPSFTNLEGNVEFKQKFNTTYKKALSIQIYTEELDKELNENIYYLGEVLGKLIEQYEQKEVIKAMGMAKGHWFKCPNGHLYAIGECGGANQIAKCADCGAKIGGRGHALLTDNRHAGEVDSSSYPAYSEAANNLFNYREFH